MQLRVFHPLCYEIRATVVTTNLTRIVVVPLKGNDLAQNIT